LDIIYADLISIDQLPQATALAEQVQQTFKLRQVIVVPMDIVEKTQFHLRTILLGETARAYFRANVHRGMKVGLAGGYSVSRMIYSLRRGECPSIEFYPLATSPVFEAIAHDANSLVGALAYRHHGYDVRGYALQYASPSSWREIDDIQNAHQLMPTRRILARAKTVNIAFMGLGAFLGRERTRNDLLGDLLDTIGPGQDEIRQRGAIGDILYHLVDRQGEPVSEEISSLICSIRLKDLREMVQLLGIPVVVIASGRWKADIARVAIRAGYANVFIIDDELARALLESEKG
jgi:DNA-binding transcriptional regulator LsrR (DeoR family)